MALETLVGAQWNKTLKRCAAFLQRISHDCEHLTELGLLQLPLPHQGASPQYQVDGSKDQSSLPKTVKYLIEYQVVRKNQVCLRLRNISNIGKGTTDKSNTNLNLQFNLVRMGANEIGCIYINFHDE